jgi:N-acetylglucosamine-6-phosphate deacetylase
VPNENINQDCLRYFKDIIRPEHTPGRRIKANATPKTTGTNLLSPGIILKHIHGSMTYATTKQYKN